MDLKPLDFNFLFKQDVNFYGHDSYGNSIYTYHDIAFVDLNGELIPYVFVQTEEE